MTTMEKEQLQDIIDRLLYLQGKDYAEYITYLHRINNLYPIEYEIINGIRVYKAEKLCNV
jgi:hypothetical protein